MDIIDTSNHAGCWGDVCYSFLRIWNGLPIDLHVIQAIFRPGKSLLFWVLRWLSSILANPSNRIAMHTQKQLCMGNHTHIFLTIEHKLLLKSLGSVCFFLKKLRARFINSLRQRKPSFGVRFTKDTQWRISTEKAWTQLFVHLTLLNMHFPFRRKIYGRKILN